MMTAKELIKAGRLSEARSVLTQEVKSAPADTGRRTLLFQVLALLGEWDKAAKHLDLVSTQDPTRVVGVQAYLNMVKAEQERVRVMSGELLPSPLPDVPPYFDRYMVYLKALGDGKSEEARELLLEIDAAIPAVSGTVNGRPFEGMSDTDSRLYPFLEAFVHERYVWIPFEAIRELVVNEARSSLDLIWAAASVTTWEGLSVNCALPVLYPGTHLHGDEQVKAGRVTDWAPLGSGLSRGAGQHVFQVGDEEMAILEIREAQFTLETQEEK
jgi:type VI secretion system protein ImpE